MTFGGRIVWVFLLVSYILFVILFFTGAILWVRHTKRALRKTWARKKMTPTLAFFFGDLPPNFYVSVEACIGFALAAALAAGVYGLFTAS